MKRRNPLSRTIPLFICGCVSATASEPRVIDLGSIYSPPGDLLSEAAELRETRGLVFVGRIDQAPQPAPPVEVHLEEMTVQYPVEIAEIHVEDALGETLGESVSAIARDGMPPVLLDADGVPMTDTVVSDGHVSESRRLLLGRSVFFIAHPPDQPATLVWRAELAGDEVLGSGTQTGENAPLTALRIVE